MWHTASWPKIALGIALFVVFGYFQYVRIKRSIAYYKRDRTADVLTLFDGEK